MDELSMVYCNSFNHVKKDNRTEGFLQKYCTSEDASTPQGKGGALLRPRHGSAVQQQSHPKFQQLAVKSSSEVNKVEIAIYRESEIESDN